MKLSKISFRVCRPLATLVFGCAGLCGIEAQNVNDVINEILRNNVQIKAQEHDMRAEMSQMKMQNNLGPTAVSYSPFFANGVHGVASSEFVLSQDFDFPTLYAQRSQLFRRQHSELQSRHDALRTDVAHEARLICLKLIYHHKLSEVLQLRAATMGNMVSLYEKKQKQGAATVIEVNKIKLESMQQAAELEQCKADIAKLEASLKALNGNKQIALKVNEYPQTGQLPDDETLVAEYVRNDKGFQADAHHTQSIAKELSISKSAWLPSLSVGYRRNTSLEEKSHGFLVGAAVPLFSNRNRVRAAKARLESAQNRAQQNRIDMETEARKILAELHSIDKSMKAYDTALMHSAMTALTKACTQGEISAIDYCRETRDITSQLVNYLTLEQEYHLLVASILKNNN